MREEGLRDEEGALCDGVQVTRRTVLALPSNLQGFMTD